MPNILVVDADRDIRDLNQELLISAGYRVDTVADGAEAWKRVNANPSAGYDILIAEHDLPKMNGVELVGKLRASHNTMPVILVFGMVLTYALRLDWRLNIGAIIYKPYEIAELREKVKETLLATVKGSPTEVLPEPGNGYQTVQGHG